MIKPLEVSSELQAISNAWQYPVDFFNVQAISAPLNCECFQGHPFQNSTYIRSAGVKFVLTSFKVDDENGVVRALINV